MEKTQSNHKENKIIHSSFSSIGEHRRHRKSLESKKIERSLDRSCVPETLFAGVTIPLLKDGEGPYHEEIPLSKDQWQKICFSIPKPNCLGTVSLVLSPLNTRGVVTISDVSLVSAATGSICWNVSISEFFRSVKINKAIRLPNEKNLVLMILGEDATLTLPLFPDLPDVPMEFHVWIKVDTSLALAASAWKTIEHQKDQLQLKLDETVAKQDVTNADLKKEIKLLSATEKELKRRKIRIVELEQAIVSTRKKKVKIENNYFQVVNELHKVKKQNSGLNNEIVNSRFHNATLRKEIDKTLSKSKDRQQRILKLEKSVETLLSEKQRADDQINMLSAKLDGREDWIRKLEQELDQGLVYIETTREKVEKNYKLQIEEYERMCNDNEIKICQMERLIKGRDRALIDANDSVNARFGEVTAIAKLLKKCEDDLATQKTKTDEQAERIEQLLADLSEANVKATNQENKLKQLEAEFEKKRDGIKIANHEKETLSGQPQKKELPLEKKEVNRNGQCQEVVKIDSKLQTSWKTMSPLRVLKGVFTKKQHINDTKEAIELITQSDLFDEKWYVEQYPDIIMSGLAPVKHYCTVGAFEGRDPGRKFHTTWYLETYPDVAQSGVNALFHYLKFGKKEGRKHRGDDGASV